ncbi:hypothetical protein D3C78_1244920 [compost metagenome]
MHALRGNVDDARRPHRQPATVMEHEALPLLQVEDLQQGAVLVRLDLPAVGAGARRDLLEMQRFVPDRRGFFAVQGVVGNLVHVVDWLRKAGKLFFHS